MDAQKQLIERLKQATNILLTVSNNPSVDQLSALIGLSLLLVKLDKHATAVYSGETPSTIAFLQPEDTIEKTTDSLRDFIISLDKSKADKLRYKVEDSVVRIFITPYRTSISDADLEFSQGDFNVDVILALGVHQQQELDQAITAHGRILHDATVMTLNNQAVAELGTVNWLNESASSVSEMATVIAVALGKDLLDEQIATALLTGIVAETERFSNEKTSANTMKASAVLMSAGANQQLVATKLEEATKAEMSIDEPGETDDFSVPDEPSAASPSEQPSSSNDGTLQISHEEPESSHEEPELPTPDESALSSETDVRGDELDQLLNGANTSETEQYPAIEHVHANAESAFHEENQETGLSDSQRRQSIKKEPTFPVYDTNKDDDDDKQFMDAMTLPPVAIDSGPVLTHDKHVLEDEAQQPSQPSQESKPDIARIEEELSAPQIIHPTPEPVRAPNTYNTNETLADLERDVKSPHIAAQEEIEELDISTLQKPEGIEEDDSKDGEQFIDEARDAVEKAMAGTEQPLEPITALNAQPLGEPLRGPGAPTVVPPASVAPAPTESTQPFTLPAIEEQHPEQQPNTEDTSVPPPPVPPPIMPPFPGV